MGKRQKMGDAHYQLQPESPALCKVLLQELHMWSPVPHNRPHGIPPPNPSVARRESFGQIPAHGHRRGGPALVPCLTWREDQEVASALGLLRSRSHPAGTCAKHSLLSLPPLERGSLQHKRGVWVWVCGRFSRTTSR